MNIGVRHIGLSQVAEHGIVPIGAHAIAPSVPNTQHEPGESREQEYDQIPFSELGYDPPEAVEKDQHRMKDEEKVIEDDVGHSIKAVLDPTIAISPLIHEWPR